MKRVEKLTTFAEILHQTLRSDRDVIIGFGGMTGEGKSVAMIQLSKAYSKLSNVPFEMNDMTWSRHELLKWIDGDEKGAGKKPEYSISIADELISMFFKRNWYEDSQKEAVELFNKCRDRHQLIMGGIPNFWDLDSGMLSRIRFYVYIPRRGMMWVFEQENNPFASDKWNVQENRRVYRKKRDPSQCPNFLCEIHYDDLGEREKKKYYDIRNTKRLNTELQNKKPPVEKYKYIKKQRNTAVRLAYETGKFEQVELAEHLEVDKSLISRIVNGTANE